MIGRKTPGEAERSSSPRPGTVLLGAVVLLLSTWLLLWMAQSVPLYCALTHPCPEPEVRAFPALLFGGLMVIPFTVILTATLRPLTGIRRTVVTISFACMAVLSVVGLGAALFAGGFEIPSVFLSGGGVAAFIFVGTIMWWARTRYRRVSR